MLSAGHWPAGPSQLVLDGPATSGQGGPQLGNTITIPGLRGSPALTIVGFANSVTSTADGWVTPARSPTCRHSARQPARRCSTGSPAPAATPRSGPT
jgi:putative ABC transport system permease protein